MTNVDNAKHSLISELADKGFDYLRADDYQAALTVYEELLKLRTTAAFEIGSQAYKGLGDLEKALEVLECGVKEAPDFWFNWLLLGNIRSDNGDYAGAELAYKHALLCQNCEKSPVKLNQAILANKRGFHEQALMLLSEIKDEDLVLEKTINEMIAFECLNQVDKAISLADTILSQDFADGNDDALAEIAAKQIRILLNQDDAVPDDLREEAENAIANYGYHIELLALIREIDSLHSDQAQYIRLLIEGTFTKEYVVRYGVKGFYVTYDVVAETPDQSLAWISRFEGCDEGGLNLAIAEFEIIEERRNDPMGVYWRSETAYYSEDKK